MKNTTTEHVTDYDTLEQYDDLGTIYGAFTITAAEYEDDESITPVVSSWYENIIIGWAAGTPEKHNVELYTIGELPEDMHEAWSTEDLEDWQREELAERVYLCTHRPHDEKLAENAGLVHLGSVTIDGRRADWALRDIVEYLDSIDYDDVTSF